ncbi:MAG TPA: cupin domain-containing protein [Acidimicrobiales bacterium]|nr:cupin domain-containing protein [Acidimicrobiales bacterium]
MSDRSRIQSASGGSAAAAPALERCAGDPTVFLKERWQRRALYRPGADPSGFADVLSLADVGELLSGRGMRHPAVRVVEGGTKIPRQQYTMTARLGGEAVPDVVHAGRLWDRFAAGATIVLNSLHRYWPPVARFCRDLETSLSHGVQANAYVTPPREQGLNVHYDTHDVFVLQLSGTKRWKLFGAGMTLPLASQHGSSTLSFDDPAEEEMTLRPGDCLYVPRGHLHAAQSGDEISVHLTVGILTFTWVDAFKLAFAGAEDEPSFREALPAGYADAPAAELEDAVRARIAQLRDWLDGIDGATLARDVQRRFHAGRVPLLHGHLDQLVRLGTIADDTVVRRRPYTPCRLELGELSLDLVLGDRIVRMPARVAPAVELLLEKPTVAVGELDAWLDPDGRLLLVRRLVREGLLEQVER